MATFDEAAANSRASVGLRRFNDGEETTQSSVKWSRFVEGKLINYKY
jgi:hypothetical protein